MALTDHDTVAGVDECAKLAAEAEITFIPGVEFESSEGPHILGYFKRLRGSQMAEASADYRRFRASSVAEIVAKLSQIGFRFDLESVIARAGEGTPTVAHVVAEMHSLGHLSSLDRTNREFADLFGPGAPAQIPDITERRWPVARLIRMLRDSGAVPVIAHPFRADLPLWPEMVKAGLQGVEAYHRTGYLEGTIDEFTALAKAHDLLVTGGWDYHGEAQAFRISQSDLDEFEPSDDLAKPLIDLVGAAV